MQGVRIVVLTGAGISAESGMGTFRDKDGIWTKVPLEDVATPEGFARNPQLVHDFYNARRAALKPAKPNAAHFALAELERAMRDAGGDLLIVTQNVDNLHEKAGSENVLHMHGELTKVFCGSCHHKLDWFDDLGLVDVCGHCGKEGLMRPDVVWFGEMPYHMENIYQALGQADLFVSIGTSGSVYPAAGFVNEARMNGVSTLELNLEPSENAHAFDDGRYGAASEIVPAWVDDVLKSA
ncbi:Sir2 family NAD+-dependent deacetylase [Ponticaulis profundi]|uniref:NAD-dependent protein deacylase n=1 Tax=Ponticaulis profundi TaxID=2665222 RepID=A0ABW1SCI4_9PROT